MRIILVLLIINTFLCASEGNGKKPSDGKERSVFYKIDYSTLKDTLFTLAEYFVEVDLNRQMAYLHSRSDSVKLFGVSTGTTRIKDGVETNEGVFAIQFKVERWHSTQFDSTLMLDFMTFNWGIGFHALAGKSYYQYLGVKRSSHGCVRVSKEMGRELYRKIKYGTPVIVHRGNPAVFIGFADKNDPDLVYTEYSELKKNLAKRIERLYRGEYFLYPKEKLLMDNKNVTHFGLPVGDGSKISRRQYLKPDYLFVDIVMPEILPWHIQESQLTNSIQPAFTKGRIPHPSSFLDDVFD